MMHTARRLSLLGFLVVASGGFATASPVPKETDESPPARPSPSTPGGSAKDDGFRIVDPVVCRDIKGYEDYEELPDAELTSDEKLLIYYRPEGFKVVQRGDKFVAHLTQVGQVRPLGEKKILLRKSKLLDYEAESDEPPEQIYIRNTFSLKGLPPGEYEFDMILTDANAKAQAKATAKARAKAKAKAEPATVTGTVKFRVVAPKLPERGPEAEAEPEPEPSPPPKSRSRARR
jgi:hypothetical protein